MKMNASLAATTDVSKRAGYDSTLFRQAFFESLKKFDPRLQIRNPVMFVVWIGALITLALTFKPSLFGPSHASAAYNAVVTLILVVTLWFANIAEALAEGRGKAKAMSLRHITTELTANRLRKDGRYERVSAAQLQPGDVVKVEKDEIIPTDGEVSAGTAYVDESMITGESAPVMKFPGSDIASTVTGGTRLLSDNLLIRVTALPGNTFLDRMIKLVEGARRQKTPNEIALTVLLSVLTLIFVIVVSAMAPVASFLNMQINIATWWPWSWP
jgi:K+-transporting ATPase ATPase B chain